MERNNIYERQEHINRPVPAERTLQEYERQEQVHYDAQRKGMATTGAPIFDRVALEHRARVERLEQRIKHLEFMNGQR